MDMGPYIAESDRLAVALEEKRRLLEETARLVRQAREEAESAAYHFRELRNGTPEWRLIWPREGPVVTTPDSFPGRREDYHVPSPLRLFHGTPGR